MFKKESNYDINAAINNRFPRLLEREWVLVNTQVIEEDVKNVLFDIAPFKSPNSNGLHARFYSCMWDVVGLGIIEFARL